MSLTEILTNYFNQSVLETAQQTKHALIWTLAISLPMTAFGLISFRRSIERNQKPAGLLAFLAAIFGSAATTCALIIAIALLPTAAWKIAQGEAKAQLITQVLSSPEAHVLKARIFQGKLSVEIGHAVINRTETKNILGEQVTITEIISPASSFAADEALLNLLAAQDVKLAQAALKENPLAKK